MKVAPVISLPGAVDKDMEVLNVNAPNALPLNAHVIPCSLIISHVH